MTEHAVSHRLVEIPGSRDKRELPVGSELMIAFALGAGGWYVIVRLIQWIAG